ncbi:MAG: SURF1 family protein [Dongiaceae bacterium]
MRFRPTLWPTLFTVPALIVLVGLGIWQLERLQWKVALIAERTARTTAEPIPLPAAGAALSAAELADLDYRHASATGEFLHDRELLLAARTMAGAVGYQVVTPLRLPNGGVLLINRGWVPDKFKDAALRAEGQVTGMVTIDGAIRAPAQQHWLQPDNDPARNVWFWADLPAMAAAAGVGDRLVPIFLEAGPAANPGGYPIGGQSHVNLPNDHLQYAITWFSLALALAVIYLVYHRRAGGHGAADGTSE